MPTTSTKAHKISKKKSVAATAEPNITSRLHDLRRAAGLSQETIGYQGFISARGWIQVEKGRRTPSEELLAAFVNFLAGRKVIRANQQAALLNELCVLKYIHHQSNFLRQMARNYQQTLSPVVIQTAQKHLKLNPSMVPAVGRVRPSGRVPWQPSCQGHANRPPLG